MEIMIISNRHSVQIYFDFVQLTDNLLPADWLLRLSSDKTKDETWFVMFVQHYALCVWEDGFMVYAGKNKVQHVIDGVGALCFCQH